MPMTWARRLERGYELTIRSTEDRYLTPILQIATVRLQDPEQGPYWRVDTMRLVFFPWQGHMMRPLAEMVGYDWEGFDTCAASLPVLRHLVVGFMIHGALTFFSKEIEPRPSQSKMSWDARPTQTISMTTCLIAA